MNPPEPRVIPGRMNMNIIETDINAMGRYVHTAEVSGTVSGRTGGSWRFSSPSGISGPRRRAGRRNRITLKEPSPSGTWGESGRNGAAGHAAHRRPGPGGGRAFAVHAPYAALRPGSKARPTRPPGRGRKPARGNRVGGGEPFRRVTVLLHHESGKGPRDRFPRPRQRMRNRFPAERARARPFPCPDGQARNGFPGRTGTRGTVSRTDPRMPNHPSCPYGDRAAIRRTRKAVSYSVARATWSRLGG